MPPNVLYSFSESVNQLWWFNIGGEDTKNVPVQEKRGSWWNDENFMQPSIFLKISI